MSLIQFFVNHWQEILNAIVLLLTAFIATALIIPGDQPEKFLQAVVDFLKKLSIKPKNSDE